MSCSHYGVTVLAKDGASLTLLVVVLGEDAPASPEPCELDVFARFLCDDEIGRRPLLPQRIEADGGDAFDSEWLWANVERYVTRVERVAREPRGQAVFRVALTDPALAAHLDVGSSWESCAYGSLMSSTIDLAVGGARLDEVEDEERQRAEDERQLARQHIAAVDAALAAEGVAVWRTSASDDNGRYGVVVQEKADLIRAIEALRSIGFTLVGRDFLKRGATDLELGVWDPDCKVSFCVRNKLETVSFGSAPAPAPPRARRPTLRLKP